MKRIAVLILVVLILVVMVGCSKGETNSKVIASSFFGAVRILEIDGCEYVFVKDGYSGGLSHKGNCSNREHR